MDGPSDRFRRTADEFESIWHNRGFWSCFGYEGLSIVFDLPPEAFQLLSEQQKHALMRLLGHLAEGEHTPLHDRVRELETLTMEERLAGFLKLSEPFIPGD
jgi:hypothetical protein